MTRQEKDRITAGAGTAIVVVLLLLGLMSWYCTVNPADLTDREWPPVDSSEIVFGGEYVRLGDMPLPTDQAASTPAPEVTTETPAVEGTELTDAGAAVAEAEPPVTTTHESPMKVNPKPKPEKTGPTKEELAEKERIKRQKEEEEKKARIKSQMQSGFNKRATGTGTPGSPDGNSTDAGALSGAPGHTLTGRTAQSWGRPKSTVTGTVKVKVRVNRQGYVVGTPEIVGGTAPAASNAAVRQSCIEASRQSRFSVDLNAAAEQTGVITWKFE